MDVTVEIHRSTTEIARINGTPALDTTVDRNQGLINDGGTVVIGA